MRILIIYGTSEGQTRKIARFMEEVLQEKGHQVIIADASKDPPEPTNFDAIMIGSSIHMHKYHNAVKHYVVENLEILNQMPGAFFSVSMAVASDIEEEHREVHEIAMEFLAKTGWTPHEVIQMAGALKYTQYDYLKRLIMRMIAKKQGRATDTSSDHEYTDWKAVKKFARRFVENIPAEMV